MNTTNKMRHPFSALKEQGVVDFFGLTSFVVPEVLGKHARMFFLQGMGEFTVLDDNNKEVNPNVVTLIAYGYNENPAALRSEKELFDRLAVVAERAKSDDRCYGVVLCRPAFQNEQQVGLNLRLREFAFAHDLVVIQFAETKLRNRPVLSILEQSDIALTVNDYCVFEVEKNRRAL